MKKAFYLLLLSVIGSILASIAVALEEYDAKSSPSNRSDPQIRWVLRQGPFKGITDAKADLDTLVKRFLTDHGREVVRDSDFHLLKRKEGFLEKKRVGILLYEQLQSGLPVFGSFAKALSVNGEVVAVTWKFYPDSAISLTPSIDAHRASVIAREHAKIDASVENGSLVLYPGQSRLHLAWKIELPLTREPLSAWVYLVDANDGKVLFRYDRIRYELSGKVQGVVYPEYPKKGNATMNFSHQFVQVEQGSEGYVVVANITGDYMAPMGAGTVHVSAALNSPFVDVINLAQPRARHSAAASAPGTYSWNWFSYDTSYKGEESNVFYHVNVIHDYFTQGFPFDIDGLDYPMPSYVGESGECNAFATGTSIHFMSAGDTCEATSLGSDIIYHEYTHNVVANAIPIYYPYKDETGAMNEGWADFFAANILNRSTIGEGIWEEPIRYLNNTLRYPMDLVGQVHADSRIFSGALWDLRGSLGRSPTENLTILSMQMAPFSFSENLLWMLLFDDDNWNLSDGTPNSVKICDAFYGNHGIYNSFCLNQTSSPIAIIDHPVWVSGMWWSYIENKLRFDSGTIAKINGTAYPSKGSSITNYTLEYRRPGEATWTLINFSTTPVVNGTLGTWNTSGLSYNYELRLTVNDTSGSSTNYTVRVYIDPVKIVKILLVDDDNASYEKYYTDAINASGYTYTYWNVTAKGSPSYENLSTNDIVIWFTGNEFLNNTTLTTADRINLAQYLDDHGSLFLSGQDIGYDLTADGTVPNETFYANYIHANYVQDDTNIYTLVGAPADAIGDGLTLNISGGDGANNQNYQSEISPRDANASCIFNYSSNGCGAIKVERPTYRLVYFAFGFEAINSSSDRNITMSRIISWLLSDEREHDVALDVSLPTYAKPGEEVRIDAWIKNKGKRDETNVLVTFDIDGFILNRTIPSLPRGQSAPVSFVWSSTVEKMYNFSLSVQPLEGEFVTYNNYASGVFRVTSKQNVSFLVLGWGSWSSLESEWPKFGDVPVRIEILWFWFGSFYDVLADLKPDVLVLSDQSWGFSSSMLDDIRRYVREGHGLVVTCMTFANKDNRQLAPLLGMREDLDYISAYFTNFTLLQPTHPLLKNLPSPYVPDYWSTSSLSPPDTTWDSEDVVGATYVAIADNKSAALIVYKNVTYITHCPERSWGNTSDLQLMYNAIVWSRYIPIVSVNITSFSTEKSAYKLGQIINSTITVNNTGDVEDLFLIIVSGTSTTGYPLGQGTSFVELSPGSSASVRVVVPVHPTVETGTYTLYADVYRVDGAQISERIASYDFPITIKVTS